MMDSGPRNLGLPVSMQADRRRDILPIYELGVPNLVGGQQL